MIERIRKSFNEGVKSIKWFADFLSERLRVEASIAKLLYTSSRLESRIYELHMDIGRRVMELKEKEDKAVLKDFIIMQSIDEINRLKSEIDDYKNKAHAMSKLADVSPTEK
ncbi:MAG: hypothetical protein HY756_05070 [Nitrospirae bacterium]|nr:hypothetical protein [Nitrospirota bacterium]